MPRRRRARGFYNLVTDPITVQTWNLAYVDTRILSGFHGSPITGPIPSQGAGASLSVTNAPTFDDCAIGGTRGIFCPNGDAGNSALNYFRCDSVASRITIGNTFTIGGRLRPACTSVCHLLSAASSADASHNFFLVQQDSATGKIQIVTDNIASGTITRIGSINWEYDDHTVFVVSDGAKLFMYVDGVLDPLDNNNMHPTALTCDRFAILAQFSTAANATSTGYLQNFCASSSALTAAQIAAQHAQWLNGDFTKPMATRKQFAWLGDSIDEGSATPGYGGYRKTVGQWAIDNGLSINFVGFRQFGFMAQRHEFAQGGADITGIALNFTSNIGSYTPDLVWFGGMTNNMGSASGAFESAYDTALAAVDAAAVAANPNSRLILKTITPFDPAATPQATNQPIYNTYLTGTRRPAYNAAHPTRPSYLYDVTVPVPSWSAPTYVDQTHPNAALMAVIGADIIVNLGLVFRGISSTLNVLNAVIALPTTGSSLPHGTPVTVSGTATRTPVSVNFYVDGVLQGAATVTGKTWTYSWTPTLGQVGTRLLTVVAIDALDTTTAQSTNISVTVT